jgi:uncharacterized protein (UPF0332 family)
VTSENRRKNIESEVRRGDEALKSAQLLLAAGQLADAVSRAYYAAFHFARGLLFMLGEEARTHGGVERLLQRDLVRTGRLDPDKARLLSRLLQFRLEADYTAEYVFTERGVAEDVEAATQFVAEARRLLVAEGWLA